MKGLKYGICYLLLEKRYSIKANLFYVSIVIWCIMPISLNEVILETRLRVLLLYKAPITRVWNILKKDNTLHMPKCYSTCHAIV